MSTPYKVLVGDDSPFVCRLLQSYLKSAPDLEVVGTANDGPSIMQMVESLKPDVLTLDVEMPSISGLEVLEQIMAERPTPVIMVSGVSRKSAAITLRALDLGAVDFILKYVPGVNTDPETLRHEVISKVRAAAKVRVVRSSRGGKSVGSGAEQNGSSGTKGECGLPAGFSGFDGAGTETSRNLEGVIVIGASTGGPLALRELLGLLPADFPYGVIVVQHMPANFTKVLATQLDRYVGLKVKEAEHGDRLRPGLVLVAPGDHHMILTPDSRVELHFGPKIGGHRPSIDVVMQSAAQVFGNQTVGVVLTGMGNDGALGLASIRAKSGRTFAQDAESCVVNGMPQAAIEKRVVDHIAPPQRIAQLLRTH